MILWFVVYIRWCCRVQQRTRIRRWFKFQCWWYVEIQCRIGVWWHTKFQHVRIWCWWHIGVWGQAVLPSPSAIPWVPLLANVSTTTGGKVVSPVTHATSAITTTSATTHSVVSPLVRGVSQLSMPAIAAVVLVGSFMAEGLLSVPCQTSLFRRSSDWSL